MVKGLSCWPAGAHRLADGEVVRGNVKNAVMLANGNPSQVITRPSNGTHLRQLQGDRACAVARKLTRKGWPLAANLANLWRALRKCNVRCAHRSVRIE